MRRKAAYLATAVVVLSTVANVLHTLSHAGQHVMSLPGWQLAYIALVIYVAPVVAVILFWSRHRRTGAWLLFASMAGSFVFGLVFHFIVPGADNVFTLEPGTWRITFRITAVLLSLVQVIGILTGLWAAWRVSRTSPDLTHKRPADGFASSQRGSGSEFQ